MLDYCINSIPIFYFSFLKTPMSVRKAIAHLQRNFLGGGATGCGNKIHLNKNSLLWRPKAHANAQKAVAAMTNLQLAFFLENKMSLHRLWSPPKKLTIEIEISQNFMKRARRFL
jgi:hypothetical protein